METLVTDSPAHAASFVAAGHLVAFPTETVYGLGAPVFSRDSVRRIFEVKGRPVDNPLIVHIARKQDIDRVGSITNEYTRALIDAFFPGPLTIVIERRADVPSEVSAGLSTVGIRMPDHPVARAFLLACDTPMAAPSANLSGRPSPTNWSAVYDDFAGSIPCILNGGQSRVGLESTVVDCTGDDPVILRHGAISLAQLQSVVSSTRELSENAKGSERSPGTQHRHYAPKVRIKLIHDLSEISESDLDLEKTTTHRIGYIGLDDSEVLDACHLALPCKDVAEYAHRLFSFFRDCERLDIDVIYCQTPTSIGVGKALTDRLTRAASATAGLPSKDLPAATG